MVLFKDIGTIVPEKYAGRMIGWLGDDILISSKANTKSSIAIGKGGINAILLKCGKCHETMEDAGIILGGRVFTVDTYGETIEHDIDLEFKPVYSFTLCPACEEEVMLEMASRLICNNCKKQIAWLEAGNIPNGKIIEAGKEYHVEECPNCNENCKGSQIIELQ